jgi:peptidyl-prolyl cis-trans isomerase SurA
MKTSFFFLIAIFSTTFAWSQKDPVLMEIDGKKVTKSEFLQIYLKNNNKPQYDKASLDEYMTLFRKFKLKVAEAEALKYDTIPKLKKELEGYKKQLAQPYLVDAAKNEELVKEAYERIKTEVRASHILVKVESTASPADTLAAYERIMKLKKRIESGEDFTVVAKGKGGSDDPSVSSNGGDLGFFTAFQMVYTFEDAAYKTNIGSISDPIRTRFGYHIIYVKDKRPARGTMKAAHIMVATPKTATPEDITNAEKKINELYEKLQKGEKFEDLAKLHSDDPSSSQKGGELPAFGSGTTTRMLPIFEETAFGLKNNGDFSAPIRTDYGFHIIKRVDWTDVKGFSEMKKDLQSKVNRDERSKRTQDAYVEKLKKEYKFKDGSSKPIEWFNSNVDSSFFAGKWSPSKLTTDKPMFTLNGIKYGQQQFGLFLKNNQKGTKKDAISNIVKQQYKAWVKESVLAYEESRLTQKYPDYKALVTEYHDGILLYEIMTEKVWNKAIKDTVGLKEYFEKNRSKYMWGKRVDAFIYECLNAEIAGRVTQMLKNDTINSKHVIEAINSDSKLNLSVKTNKFDLENTPVLKGRMLQLGVNPTFQYEGKHYVVDVAEILEPRMKDFSEAKGAATSDYQNELERIWLEELERKHVIKIYSDVLYSLGK